MANYVTEDELKDAIGIRAFTVCFDDEGKGVINQNAVNLVLKRASRRVDGYMAKILGVPFTMPSPTPELASEAALEFATGLTYLRRKEYAARYAEKGKVEEFERAKELCKELMLNVQRMPDAPTPANVGGGVYQGTSDTTPDGVGTGLWKNGFGSF